MPLRGVVTKAAFVLLLAVFLLGVPRIAGMVASFVDYQVIDPDGAYAWITVHHVVQATMILVCIVVIRRYTPLEFGLGWGDKERGKRYVALFVLGFTIYTAFAYLILFLTDTFQPFNYPLTAVNITGQLGFQLFLSGPSEELIFRAFAITLLSYILTRRVFGGKVSIANIIAAVIFGLAHVQFSVILFAAVYDPFQVIYATVLGLFYGDCFEKTNSVIYPMIMHSFTNVLMVGVQITVTFFLV